VVPGGRPRSIEESVWAVAVVKLNVYEAPVAPVEVDDDDNERLVSGDDVRLTDETTPESSGVPLLVVAISPAYVPTFEALVSPVSTRATVVPALTEVAVNV
jgi:hypothetical protein